MRNKKRPKTLTRRRFTPTDKNITKALNNLGESFDIYKKNLVSKMFWGRSATYKNFSHFFMFFTTFLIAISGIAIRISEINANTSTFLNDVDSFATDDILHQGGSISTVLAQTSETGLNLQTQQHVVKKGEDLESIAKEYGVSIDTIRWASKDVVSPFTNKVDEGVTLTIPEINGVLYEVRAGQDLDSVIAETSLNNDEANRFNIIEFNALTPPYELTAGEKIFIPDGNLKRVGPEGSVADIPLGVFSDPLSHPRCNGYYMSRGFTWYHNGVDLAKWDGCPIRAIANGIVEYAGWASAGQGYMVRINHGGGIKTEYFHGNGQYWVKAGDKVNQNDEIMHMGSTGYSTGTHLHLILWKDGIAVDPSTFVPHKI